MRECSTTFVSRASRRWMFVVSALAGTAILSSPVAAQRLEATERELARCIAEASDGKLWLERTLWGLRDQEAGWLGAEIVNKNGSHDLGPLQVNSWWIRRLAKETGKPLAHIRWWLTNDPCFNVSAAKWIFLSGLSLTRSYWPAVGAYHSSKSELQRVYTHAVAARLVRRFGPAIFVPTSSREVGHANLRHSEASRPITGERSPLREHRAIQPTQDSFQTNSLQMATSHD